LTRTAPLARFEFPARPSDAPRPCVGVFLTDVVICRFCGTAIPVGRGRVYCLACPTPHHADCFIENGRCTVYGCGCTEARTPSGRRVSMELVPTDENAVVPVSPQATWLGLAATLFADPLMWLVVATAAAAFVINHLAFIVFPAW